MFNRTEATKAFIAATQLKNTINDFLHPLKMDTDYCRIFEETLLKLAGVKRQPSDCEMMHSWDPYADPAITAAETLPMTPTGWIAILVEGIDLLDAKQFLAFFKKHGDQEATFQGGTLPDKNNITDSVFVFSVNAHILLNTIVPLVKYEILDEYVINKPECILHYQKQCRHLFSNAALRNIFHPPYHQPIQHRFNESSKTLQEKRQTNHRMR